MPAPGRHGRDAGLDTFYTFEEAALVLFRSTSYIKQQVYRHRVPRALIRAPGMRRCIIAVLPWESVRWLRRHIHGF